MANTYSLQEIWEKAYEITHYKQPVFRAIADEKFKVGLNEGATFHREYASDLAVNNMGANGSYTTQAFTNSVETGTVNIKEETSIQLVKWQEMQDHLPTQKKYTTKAANALWLQVDATVLYYAQQGAASYIDDAILNGAAGTAGKPLVMGVSNVMNIFTTAIQQLQLLNVNYEPNKSLAKDVELEHISDSLVALISPNLYSLLLQYIGGKTTVLGDNISRNGHVGMFMGFNLFQSNALPWEGVYYGGTGNPADGDTITFLSGVSYSGVSQAITFTFKTTLGTTAGNIKICSTLAKTLTNLVTVLNAPYTSITEASDAGYAPFVQTSMTVPQQRFFKNCHATQVAAATLGGASSASGGYLDLIVAGLGNVPVTNVAASNAAAWGYQAQHCIFGTSKSVALLMQAKPHMFLNPVSGQVARDLVVWQLYGVKVFLDQSSQLIDVKVDSSNFGAAQTAVALFN